jgi:hypothetical protein
MFCFCFLICSGYIGGVTAFSNCDKLVAEMLVLQLMNFSLKCRYNIMLLEVSMHIRCLCLGVFLV